MRRVSSCCSRSLYSISRWPWQPSARKPAACRMLRASLARSRRQPRPRRPRIAPGRPWPCAREQHGHRAFVGQVPVIRVERPAPQRMLSGRRLDHQVRPRASTRRRINSCRDSSPRMHAGQGDIVVVERRAQRRRELAIVCASDNRSSMCAPKRRASATAFSSTATPGFEFFDDRENSK